MEGRTSDVSIRETASFLGRGWKGPSRRSQEKSQLPKGSVAGPSVRSRVWTLTAQGELDRLNIGSDEPPGCAIHRSGLGVGLVDSQEGGGSSRVVNNQYKSI